MSVGVLVLLATACAIAAGVGAAVVTLDRPRPPEDGDPEDDRDAAAEPARPRVPWQRPGISPVSPPPRAAVPGRPTGAPSPSEEDRVGGRGAPGRVRTHQPGSTP